MKSRNADLGAGNLAELLARGNSQTRNLTFYKLVFNALDELAREHAEDDDAYRSAIVTLASGFLAVIRPEYLPQAVAAKNLLLKKAPF